MTSSNYVPQGYGKTTFPNFYNNSMNLFQGCDFLPNCKETPCQICHECCNRLCNVCEIYHKQFYKDHATEHLHFSSTATSQSEQAGDVCPHHSFLELDLYCMLCDIKVCQKCASEEHTDHRVVRFEQAEDEAIDLYKKMNKDCLEISTKTNERIEEMKHLLNLHEEQYLTTLEQFSSFVENLKMLLDKKKNEQIAELNSKSDKVKYAMEEQLQYLEKRQEAEKELLIQIQPFNKHENKLQWLKRIKLVRSRWKLIENQHPPPFQYLGVASFISNNAFTRCIKEMTLGALQIALDEKVITENDVALTEHDGTISSGYAEISEIVEIDKKNIPANATANDDPVLTFNGTASRCRNYTDYKADIIHKTVLHFEGRNNLSVVTLDRHEGTLVVSVKDKSDTSNNTNATTTPKNGDDDNDMRGNTDDKRRNTNTTSRSKDRNVDNDVGSSIENSSNTKACTFSSDISPKSECVNDYEEIYDEYDVQNVEHQQEFPNIRPSLILPPNREFPNTRPSLPLPPNREFPNTSPSLPLPPNLPRPPLPQRKSIENSADAGSNSLQEPDSQSKDHMLQSRQKNQHYFNYSTLHWSSV